MFRDAIAALRRRRVSLPAWLWLPALAIVFRLLLAAVLPRVLHYDEPIYLLLGVNLLSGRGYSSWLTPDLHFPPLYPIVAGLFHRLTGSWEWASNLPYALFGGLLLVPIFLLARRVYGVATAWVAAGFVMLFPALSISVLYWGSMTEPLFLFLLYAAAAVLLAGLENQQGRWLAGAGGLLGLAYLTRPEGLGYFVVGCLLVLLWPARGPALGFRLRRLAGFAAFFLLFAAPYLLYLKQQTGTWTFSGKGSLSWELGGELGQTGKGYDWLTARLDSAQQEVYWFSHERFQQAAGVRQALRTDPAQVLKRLMRNVSDLPALLFEWHVFWFGLLPLLGLGLFGEAWDRVRLWRECFLLAWLLPLAGLLLFRLVLRFYAPVFPLLLIWTAHGAVVLGARVQQTALLCGATAGRKMWPETLRRMIPAAFVSFYFLLISLSLVANHRNELFLGYKKAAAWLKQHSPPAARVMTRETAVGLYAARVRVPFPNAAWEQVRDYARRHQADYLVATEFELTHLRPQLQRLLQPATLPPELQLLHQFSEPSGQVFIFRFDWSRPGHSPVSP
jgi:4-amino-4-deoxy-L-arabinose transferase-like glycosyltransferase